MKHLPLLFSSLIIILTSCQKETSYEAPRSSTGTLKSGAAGNCLPSSTNGIFKVGEALNTTHYIDVQVNVLTPGTYLIQSQTVNGFSFKAEGEFATTGLNTVRLKGSGAPATAGSIPFTITYGTLSCEIVIPVVAANTPVATFSFAAGNSGSCSTPILNGTYKAGTAVNSSSTVTLDVTVTKPGSYSITTSIVNGISFSGTGSFSAAGAQPVVLSASGTPTAAGHFSSTVSGGGTTGCSFIIPFTAAGNSSAAVYTLGNAGGNCTGVSLSGSYTAGTAMTSLHTAKINVTVTTPGTYTITTTTINGVSFSGTGNFTAAGAQQITLTAMGNSIASGTFNYPVSAATSTCSFPVNFTAAAPPAVYTLSGAPGACLSAVINGSYQAAVPLNASNTVTVKVNVTTAGTYTLTTNMVNGMIFFASGLFTSTGTVDVVLSGSGTPAAAGTTTLTPLAGTSSCTFSIPVTASPAVAAGIYTCKIDGVFTSFHDRAVADTDQQLFLEGFIGPPNGGTVPKLQLFIAKLDGSPVTPGTYNTNGIFLPNGYSIEVDYHVLNPDLSVTIWNTSSNFLPPPNPDFTIVVTSVTATRVKGTFSGQVTDILLGSTNLKTITEGKFDLPVQ